MQMRREYPIEYDFFPETYLLPYELADFKKCYGATNEEENNTIANNRKKVNKK